MVDLFNGASKSSHNHNIGTLEEPPSRRIFVIKLTIQFVNDGRLGRKEIRTVELIT